MDVSARLVAAVGLLALLPVAAFALTQPDRLSAVVTAVNVVVITASLIVALRPARGRPA